MGTVNRAVAYSIIPLVPADYPQTRQEKAWRTNLFTFRNGERGIAAIIHDIVAAARVCPAFARYGTVVAPIPRSGSSRPTETGAVAWPASDLCRELVRGGVASKADELLSRHRPVPSSESSTFRVTLSQQAASLSGELARAATVVLVDDYVRTGTQFAAACAALWAAGHKGHVCGFFFAQVVASAGPTSARAPCLVHEVRWSEGAMYAQRRNTGSWRLAR